MFGFFKKKKLFDIKDIKPVIVHGTDINSIILKDCKKIIDIGCKRDPSFLDKDSFTHDPTGKSSLPLALIEVPYTWHGHKVGGRPKYIDTSICIEAILLCMKETYPSFIVSEEHLLKLGYNYASIVIYPDKNAN
jgi:hypothetical protein